MDTRVVEFAGGPLDGQVREIPDSKLFACVQLAGAPEGNGGAPIGVDDITYRRAGRTLQGTDLYVFDPPCRGEGICA
ncbi:MAG TPA: hypothetical protein VFF79_12900 [Conexibacter sp.]|jgi:hypothetical protein|nr:hypothetical protein [Conexibacter sp.]